jgi:hypothetical protein
MIDAMNGGIQKLILREDEPVQVVSYR